MQGNLLDRVSGRPGYFERNSIAFMADGEAQQPHVPRFEVSAVAGGFGEWEITTSPEEFAPLAIAWGKLFATTRQGELFQSTDGVRFEKLELLPGEVIARSSAFVTPGGDLLVGLKHSGQSPLHRLWRSSDEGQSFQPVLNFPLGGWPAHWNYTSLNGEIFVSTYGNKQGASQYIYRSQDDGHTWTLVYDPGPIDGFHFHHILGDPISGDLFASYGDDPLLGMLSLSRNRKAWVLFDDFNLPTSGVARADGVFWGSDGWGRNHVTRYDRQRDAWSYPLRPWFGYTANSEAGQTPTANIYTMLDHDGILYAPFAWRGNEIWVSRDGHHWALAWHGDSSDKGVWHFVGEFAGLIHAVYSVGFPSAGVPQAYGYMKFKPGRVMSVAGLRVEPPSIANLASLQSSSVENGLVGWEAGPDAEVAWDTNVSFDGKASIRLANTHSGDACRLDCPASSSSFGVGERVVGRIYMRGGEAVLSVRLVDRRSGQLGPRTLISPEDVWKPVICEMTPLHAENQIAMRIEGWTERYGYRQVWLDGYQLSTSWEGGSWVPGGAARAGELVRASIDFPAEWTDFMTYQPDDSSDSLPSGFHVIKSWVTDAANFVSLGIDGETQSFQLRQISGSTNTLLLETGSLSWERGWNIRLSVGCRKLGTDLVVGIASNEVQATGLPMAVSPQEIWIGSSPMSNDQAAGLYMLHRTINGELPDDVRRGELEYVPPLGDYDSDDDFDLDDFAALMACLNGPGADERGICQLFDTDFDFDVDLHDLAKLETEADITR